jgi:hypothetical protein
VTWFKPKWFFIGFMVGFIVVTANTNHRQTEQISQLKADQATQQQQIDAVQADLRAASVAYRALLALVIPSSCPPQPPTVVPYRQGQAPGSFGHGLGVLR